MIRKFVVKDHRKALSHQPDEIMVPDVATILVTSEDAGHPVENAFSDCRGRGGDCWVAGEDGEQSLVLAFDSPQNVGRIILEVEDRQVERRQEVTLSVSQDDGLTYRDVIRQEYNFSPQGSTFEREEWLVKAVDVTHLRLRIKPDMGGKACRARVTSLAVSEFAA